MIEPGSTVTHRAFGATAFVVKRLRPDGLVDIVAKRANSLGDVDYQSLPASIGDITLVTPAPEFAQGSTVKRAGADYTVLIDHGDVVSFVVGERSKPLRGGGSVRLVAGNVAQVHKSDLVVENL